MIDAEILRQARRIQVRTRRLVTDLLLKHLGNLPQGVVHAVVHHADLQGQARILIDQGIQALAHHLAYGLHHVGEAEGHAEGFGL